MTTTTQEKAHDKRKALGRGLESLIPATRSAAPAPATAESGETVREIRIEEIERSPYQPRTHFDEAAMAELAASIRETGVLQPIVVRAVPSASLRAGSGRWSMVDGQNPHPTKTALGGPPTQIRYQLIAGERRWLAAAKAGRETVPAIVRQVSNEKAMELALIENAQREDLDTMDLARAFQRLSEEFRLTQEEMAKRTGKDRATVGNLLRLLKLPGEVQNAVASGQLSFGHAKSIMALEDGELILAAARRVIKDRLSVRETEELVNHLIYMGPLAGKKEPKPKPPEDPNVRAARIELEGRLGCRVKILDKKGKGKVVIEYRSLEDFDRILEALK